jgi:hypothetical protein
MTGRWYDPNAAERHRWIVRSILGWRQPGPSSGEHAALTVPCPHCGAAAGEACKRPAKRGPMDCAPHPSRVDAAGQAA